MDCDIPDGLSFSRVPLHVASNHLVVEFHLLTWQWDPKNIKEGAARSLQA